MVWAIAIICVSLSCEPVPQMLGWYFSEQDCTDAALMIGDKPEDLEIEKGMK